MPGFGHTLATARPDEGGLLIFALGQSGFALRSGDGLVLIDPWLSTKLEEEEGVTRHVAPALRPDEIEAADVVCVTHEHADHLDPWTLAAIARQAPGAIFLAPAPAVALVEAAGVPRERIHPTLAGVALEAAGARVTACRPRTSCIPTRSAATASGSTSTATTARSPTWSSSTAMPCSTRATRSGGPGWRTSCASSRRTSPCSRSTGATRCASATACGEPLGGRGRGARGRRGDPDRRPVPLRRRRRQPRRSRRVRARAGRAEPRIAAHVLHPGDRLPLAG